MAYFLAGLLVAILSSTVVSAALPTIIADLDGSQSSFKAIDRRTSARKDFRCLFGNGCREVDAHLIKVVHFWRN